MEKHSMSDWQTQVHKLLADYEGITRERCAAGLASFHRWYVQSYPMSQMLRYSPIRKCVTIGPT
jgi:hypothetical protein